MRWSPSLSAATTWPAADKQRLGSKNPNQFRSTTARGADLNDEELRRWVQLAVDAAEDKLGHNTDAFLVGEILGITDWFVITSGGSPRQVRAIVEEIEEQLTRAGGPKPIRIEGRETLSWVLMDYGSFVVHVFNQEAREYYDLERLWKDVPRLSSFTPTH